MNRRGPGKRKEGNVHISLRTIEQYLLHGQYPTASSTLEKRSIRKRAESFKIADDNVLYYIVKPKHLDSEPPDPDPGADRHNYRKAVFTPRDQLTLASKLHINAKGKHMGTERTLNVLTAQYYWVGMSVTVRKVIKNCNICLSVRPLATHVDAQSTPAIVNALVERESKETAESNFVVTAAEAGRENANEESPYVDQVKGEIIEHFSEKEVDFELDPNLVLRHNELMATTELLRAQCFWEQVEILVLGIPNKDRKKKMSYVVVAVDSYSRWPEAMKIDSINEKAISQFVIQLISRYGVMEQLVLLENETLKDSSYLVYSSLSENLNSFNISVNSHGLNLYDETWLRICKIVRNFVKQYPDDWPHSLDICLMPLRISVSSMADYSPAYLLMKRDPNFPSWVLPERDSVRRELMLNQCQLQTATDEMMRGFVGCSYSDVKEVISLPVQVVSSADVADKEDTPGIRRSNRKSRKFHRLAGFDDDSKRVHNGEAILSSADDTGESSTVPMKKQTSEGLKGNNEIGDNLKHSRVQRKRKRCSIDGNDVNENQKGHDILENVDTDLLYLIIKRFLESASFPPNSPLSFKQAVRSYSETYSIDDGKLMLNHKRGKKTVSTTLKERLQILNETHISKDEHRAKSKMLDELDRHLVFWKEMRLDVDAFVKACPGCKHGNVRRKSTKSKRRRKDWDNSDEEDGISDDETSEGGDVGKASYKDLIKYLKKDIYPKNLTRAELVIFKKKARSFKVVKGDLHYCPVSMSKAACKIVLLADEVRQGAMRKAHGGSHILKGGMITELKKKYFWHGMGLDVERFIESCCQPESEKDKNMTDEQVSERVKYFQDYFIRKELSCVESDAFETLFPCTADESHEPEPKPRTRSVSDNEEVISLDEQTGLLRQKEPLPQSANQNQQDDKNEVEDKSSVPMEVTETETPREVLSHHDIKKSYGDNEDGQEEELEDDRDEDWAPPVEKEIQHQTPKVSKRKGEKIRCEHCHIIVRGENNYKEHKYKHTGIKPFQCQQCPKMFTSIKGVRMHMRKHTGLRPYLCNICGRGFPRSASLRYHIKTHDKTATVPFVCEICDRKFTTEHRLRKHTSFKHPEEAPVYKCDQCGRQFTAKRSLKRHQEAHQGIRRYECHHCKRSFFRKEYLNYHLESHYKDGPSNDSLSAKRRFKKRTLMQQQDSKESVLSIVSIDNAAGQEEVYSQLMETANPDRWAEIQNQVQGSPTLPSVISLEGGLQVEDIANVNEPNRTVVMMEDQVAGNGEMVHFIMPSPHVQQQPQQQQPQVQQMELQSHQHQPGVKHSAIISNTSDNDDQPQMIEVTLSSGQKSTLTLAGTNTLRIGDSNQETVQYHVECLPGETLTEADFQAIQMLAQASVLQQH